MTQLGQQRPPFTVPRPAPRRPGRPRRPRRRRLRLAAIVALLLLTVPAVSLTRALTYPGSAPASVRVVEWVRDNGGAGTVDALENWWYTRHPPPATGTATDPLAPQVHTAAPAAPAAAAAQLPRVRLLPLTRALAGEGRWRVAASAPAGSAHPGRPTLFTTWFRPDARHATVVVAGALLPRGATALHLVAGTREPVPGLHSPEGFRVPTAQRGALVAVFNAGFKTQDSRGGWYAHGRAVVPLVKDAASLVIADDGTATVRAWTGASRSVPAGVSAVRQNLALVVDHGAVVPGLTSNTGQHWGSSHNQFQYTWRSGVGTDAAGNLLYVAGRGLTLPTLAAALVDAGAVTGMELDIHTGMVAFTAFPHAAPTGSKGYTTMKLLTTMPQPRDRYLVADQRDFFYVTAR
ncbi:phosphodiester glycosidase family protein [Kineosporia sp. A_224]|uniref:phosphodiester glycosidase family protein n=1 Tax=Kineosporia sp. A_224 TaxID=1962180 RepID=UPI000B4B70A1|nr:phosphodiester glycosidase family protein [Kineosporia sp. A_224]